MNPYAVRTPNSIEQAQLVCIEQQPLRKQTFAKLQALPKIGRVAGTSTSWPMDAPANLDTRYATKTR